MSARCGADVRQVRRMNVGFARERRICHETAHQSPCRHLPRARAPSAVQSSDDHAPFPAVDVRCGRRTLALCARGGPARCTIEQRLSGASHRSSSSASSRSSRHRDVPGRLELGLARDRLPQRDLPRGEAPPPRDEPVPRAGRRPEPRLELHLAAVRRLRRGAPDAAAGRRGRHRSGDSQPDRVRRRPLDRRRPRLARLRSIAPLAPGDRRDANGAPDARPLPPRSRSPGAPATGFPSRASRSASRSRSSSSSGHSSSGSRRCGGGATPRSRPASPLPRSCSCCRSSRCPNTPGSCAGSGRPSTRTASPRSACSRSWALRIASRTSSPLAIGIAVLAIAWRRQSFVLFVAAALLLSPIVWLDYYALLAVPLAVVRPRLSVALAPAAPHVGHHLGRYRRRACGDLAPNACDLRCDHRLRRPRRAKPGRRAGERRCDGPGGTTCLSRRDPSRDRREDEPSIARRTFDVLADNSLLVLVFCAIGSAPPRRVRAGHRRRRHVAEPRLGAGDRRPWPPPRRPPDGLRGRRRRGPTSSGSPTSCSTAASGSAASGS